MGIIFFQKIDTKAHAEILIVSSLFGKNRDTRRNSESAFNVRQVKERIRKV